MIAGIKKMFIFAAVRAGYKSRARSVQCVPIERRQEISMRLFNPHVRKMAAEKRPVRISGITATGITTLSHQVQRMETGVTPCVDTDCPAVKLVAHVSIAV